MSTIAKKLKAIADSKEAIRKKLFISPEVPLSAYAELVPGSPAVVKPDQSTFDSALPFGRMKLLEASKEALRVGLGLPVAVPFSAYAEKVAAPAYAADFLTGNFRKNDVEVAFEEVAEFTRLSAATGFSRGKVTLYSTGELRVSSTGLLMEPEATNILKDNYSVASSPLWRTYPRDLESLASSGSDLSFLFTPPAAKGPFYVEQTAVGGNSIQPKERTYSLLVKSRGLQYLVISHLSSFVSYAYYTVTIDLFSGTGISNSVFRDLVISHEGAGWWNVSFTIRAATPSINPGYNYFIFSVSDKLSAYGITTFIGDSTSGYEVLLPQYVVEQGPSSAILTENAPATRAPDILRVPLPAGHTLTLDADEGIKAERDGDFAVITADKPGYLRRFAVGPVRRSTMDFTKGEYKEGNVTVELSRLAEFTRLSEATDFSEGELVEYTQGAFRVNRKGLLIEPEATNQWYGDISSRFASSGNDIQASIASIPGAISGEPVVKVEKIGANARYAISSGGGSEMVRSAFYKSDIIGSVGVLIIQSKAVQLTPAWQRKSSETIVTGPSSAQLHLLDFRSSGTDLTEAYVQGLQIEDTHETSHIPTTTTPVTRAPDILRVPVSATQTLTYDADLSISMEMDGTTAVFTATEPGYIRSITLTEK